MSTKLGAALVILLAVALVAGTGYLLVRPVQAETLAVLGQRGDGSGLQQGGGWTAGRGGAGYGYQAADGCVNGCTGYGVTGQRAGSGYGSGAAGDCVNDCTGYGATGQRAGQVSGSNGSRGGQGIHRNGGAQGPFNPAGTTDHSDEWQTIEGKVTVVDVDMTMQTADGTVVVGLGQSWYREDAGFTLKVGDEVSVTGFYEDGEFKAGTIENQTTGETLVLRDETGRPMWSGRGMQRYQ